MALKTLTSEQISALESLNCSASDWSQVKAADGFDPSRVKNVNFIGSVELGANQGDVELDGNSYPCGLSNVTVANCEIGNDVLISGVASRIANLKVEDNVVIINVGCLAADPNAACGNGVEAEALNEGGGRELKLFNGLNSQIAYMHAVYRHNEKFIENLESLIDKEIEKVKSEKVVIGKGACITHCNIIKNVAVGPYAVVDGALSLKDGTINSCQEAPTTVGAGVCADNFIISEGASVTSGVILSKSFVGQATKMGKQYSAENSVYFANCEAFHGEGCAIFAGPYSVSHHKSTLMIGSMFSFYNAGSGTNQSNHMYKLGPVHQGIFERGSKTGSFSYLLLEGHVSAFSVIIGKHMTNVNIPNMPFSYVLDSKGKSVLLPALNLLSIGTVRDGEKWPSRDKRKMAKKRDLIVFDVYSPYTIEKMRNAVKDLQALKADAGDAKEVAYGGCFIPESRLDKAADTYKLAIDRYLCGKVVDKIEAGNSLQEIQDSMKSSGGVKEPKKWTDLSGLLALSEKASALEAEVAGGKVSSMEELEEKLKAIFDAYASDEWDYVCAAFEEEYGKAPSALAVEDLKKAAEDFGKASETFFGMILKDSKKEFDAAARIGYGLDQSEEDKIKDFEAVRGTAETNKVIKKLEGELNSIIDRSKAVAEKASKLG